AESGTVLDISLTTINGTLDPLLRLMDSTGATLAENDDVSSNDKNSLISAFTIPADGTYTIIVTRFDEDLGLTSGEYRLTLSESDSAGTESASTPEGTNNAGGSETD